MLVKKTVLVLVTTSFSLLSSASFANQSFDDAVTELSTSVAVNISNDDLAIELMDSNDFVYSPMDDVTEIQFISMDDIQKNHFASTVLNEDVFSTGFFCIEIRTDGIITHSYGFCDKYHGNGGGSW